MDPQMVWDMMDECDAQDTPAPSPCAVSDKKAEAPPEPEVSCKTTSGFMGFSLFGLPR